MNKWLKLKAFCLLFLVISGCAGNGDYQGQPHRESQPVVATDRPETVLTDGMRIVARNGNGRISITTGEGLRRIFEWGDRSKRLTLTPRRTRWNGSLGAYDPGSTFFRRTTVVAEEGRQFFDSVDEAMRFLYGGSLVMLPVWTPDGLVVGFGRPPNSDGDWRVGVNVYQIYINGQKPTDLPGARPDLIRVAGGKTALRAKPNDAEIGYVRIRGKKRLVLDVNYSPLTGLAER